VKHASSTEALGSVDRTRTIRFTFDGRELTGFGGDTLASALLRNGVHLVGRSFKYHRPRGILAAGSEEPNALVAVRRDDARYTPNLRATQVELYDGLEVHSQNRWPSLSWDFGSLNNLISPFIPAGFYYKTFMWPRSAWKSLYEPRIRAAAGLGKSPTLADPDRYTNRFAHCDVLVVGAGPAGLSAALAAASSGAKVIICDEQPEFGGSLLSEPAGPRAADIEGVAASTWLARTVETLKRNPRVTVLARTTAFGYFPHNMVGLNERLTDHLAQPHPESPRERQWQVRAKEVVLAAGAIERPLVFPGNDRPGIMLAAAARTYVNRYGAVPGSRAVVITACDEAYRAALDLHEAGVFIAIIADIRAKADGPLAEAARHAGLPVQTATTIVGTSGRLRVDTVRLARVDEHGHVTDGEQIMPCDLVLMSGGFTPTVHLFSQSRGKLVWDEKTLSFIPGQAAERVRSAGACRGVFALAAVLNDGNAAGSAAAAAARAAAAGSVPAGGSGLTGGSGPTGGSTNAASSSLTTARSNAGAATAGSSPAASPTASAAASPATLADPPIGAFAGALPQPGGATGSMAFVDWQNDVTTKDLALATREGFRSVEHIKRYTTTGMATDQGKTSNLNALGFVSRQLDKAIPEVGLTTFRMPYTPVSFASFAGFARRSLFDPIRRTPTHDWAARNGAVFEDVGLWKRAHYFPRSSAGAREDMHAAVARECLAVRKSVGMFDASTLGKIEVVGKDAVTFMNRMYVNGWTSLAVGRSRYGVLLRDDGFVYDDGVVARTAEDRFHVTTTTGGAAGVLRLMEDYLQTEWPNLDVWLTSISEQWSVIAVQGPNSRRVLEKLVEGIDMSAQAMPHMSVARGRICGAPMLLFRVSFTGELGFEVNVPADFGQAVWEAIYAAGQQYDITPYGTEAMHVLRAEKGYIIVGQETDGTVTPDDAGLGWAIGKTKPDFVGKRSLQRPSMSAPDRKQLVGLFTADPQVVLDEGSQIMQGPGQQPPVRPIGHVTSSYDSAVLGKSIALALLSGGRARMGETLYVPTGSGDIAVKVTSPVFYDPEGARLNG
jgi:sarcosine oxidase subunit alpha